MKVCSISGNAQMGKDTLGDRLQLRLSTDWDIWKRSAFAYHVKRIFCETFDVDMAFIEKWKTNSECPPGFTMPVRKALQFIGDGFREIQPQIWIDLAFRRLENNVIFSDGRYPNEFVRVNEEGGFNILIGRTAKINYDDNGSEAEIRPYVLWALKNLPGPYTILDNSVDYTYAPEKIRKFNIFVRNDGTVADLYKTVDEVVTKMVVEHNFGV
jgi:hypothetical protein